MSVTPDAVKRLQKTDLAQAGIIRSDATGHLVRLKGSDAPPDVVLPENFALKAPEDLGSVPGRLALTLVHSKKSKQSDTLAPESFFVYLTGATPDGAVLDLLSKDWAFTNIEEQFAAMQGFVASFADSPGAEEFRTSLQRKLTTGIAAFEGGGPYKDLVFLRRFSELGRQAFPKDATLGGLHETIVSRIDFVEAKLKLLRTLAILGDSDALLDQYRDFERYQWSFPDVIAIRQDALEESARAHAIRARAFSRRDDHETATKEAGTAQLRDPNNKEIDNLLEAEKVLASQIESRRNASLRRTTVTKDSPEDRRFQRALAFGDRYIQDKDYTKATESLQEAEGINPDAPEILLTRARLFASGDRLAEALPLLDRYDRLVVETADRDKGNTVRDQVLYELRKRRDAFKKDLDALLKDGQYSKVDELLKAALKIDGSDLDFLFNGGMVAAAMRDGNRATGLLSAYLERSNSLGGDLKKRQRAMQIQAALKASRPAAAATDGTPNWLSGRKLPAGAYYCPESVAFQIPIESVSGDKVKMSFAWDKGRLESIATNFEDPKGYRTFRTLVAPGAPDDAAATPGADLGKFYFQYASAPGALLTVGTKAPAAGSQPRSLRVHVVHEKTHLRMADDENQTEILLPGNPLVDLDVMSKLEGPVATTVAGNSFFNPFLWDGLHYFTMQYDSQGRAESAQEWDADNLVRFTWDGLKLTGIRAYKKGASSPYYQRTISYAGPSITAEDYTLNGRNGHIRYVYGNDKSLQQIKVENEGKDWIVKPRS